MSEREYRSVPFEDADVVGRQFRGYAAVFDGVADLGDFTEEVLRGAFRKSLSSDPYVPMLFNHNGMLPPLASTRSGMTLREDTKGLWVEAELASHFAAEAVLEGVARGDIRGMSFGFINGAGNSKIEMRGGRPHRTITNFKALLDVSPTHDPAYAETTAEVRSMIQQAVPLDVQTSVSGEQPQTDTVADEEAEGTQQNTNETEPDMAADSSEEQRSGADLLELEAAARQRELEALAVMYHGRAA